MTKIDDDLKRQIIDTPVEELIKNCSSLLFSLNDSSDSHSLLCGSIFGTLDNSCRSEYYHFCFGDSWEKYNYLLDKRVYDTNNPNRSKECEKTESSTFCIGDTLIRTSGGYCIIVTLEGDNKCGGKY